MMQRAFRLFAVVACAYYAAAAEDKEKPSTGISCDSCITLAEILHGMWAEQTRHFRHEQGVRKVNATTLIPEILDAVGAVCSHRKYVQMSDDVRHACADVMGTRHSNSPESPWKRALAEAMLNRNFETIRDLIHRMCMKDGLLGRVCRAELYSNNDPPPPMVSTTQRDDTKCQGCMRVAGRLHFLGRRSLLQQGNAIYLPERRKYFIDQILEDQLCHHSTVLPSVHEECEDVRDAILDDDDALDDVAESFGMGNPWRKTKGNGRVAHFPALATKVCVEAAGWCTQSEINGGPPPPKKKKKRRKKKKKAKQEEEDEL